MNDANILDSIIPYNHRPPGLLNIVHSCSFNRSMIYFYGSVASYVSLLETAWHVQWADMGLKVWFHLPRHQRCCLNREN
jgi:hypothetical protein